MSDIVVYLIEKAPESVAAVNEIHQAGQCEILNTAGDYLIVSAEHRSVAYLAPGIVDGVEYARSGAYYGSESSSFIFVDAHHNLVGSAIEAMMSIDPAALEEVALRMLALLSAKRQQDEGGEG